MEEGEPLQTWWQQQFANEELPAIQTDDRSLRQQEECVTAQTCRAGMNDFLKPHSALKPHLRIGQQPHGGWHG